MFKLLSIVILVAGTASAQYGLAGGYGGYPYGQADYGVGYGFVSAGHGGFGPHHQPQFGIAKVQVAQNPHNYQYSVQESGPYYHKQVHQTASTHHQIAAPVAIALGGYGGQNAGVGYAGAPGAYLGAYGRGAYGAYGAYPALGGPGLGGGYGGIRGYY